jgi:hypothetical protein
MGYDMKMVRTPDRVPAGYTPPFPDSPGYFRYAVRAMNLVVGAMEWAGAIYHAERPRFPPFPPPGFADAERAAAVLDRLALGVDDGPEAFDPPATAEELESAGRYRAACEALVTRETLQDDAVAAYKWRSNEGWLVTPAECRAVARRVRAHTEVIARDYFTDAGMSAEQGRAWLEGWAGFHELAAEHGGYRVY